MRIGSRSRGVVLGLILFLSGWQATTATVAWAFQARATASLDRDGAVWVGERATLRVDLATDGFSFRDQRIRVPEIPGLVVLEDAVTTVKLSETVDGEPWQVLRYEYPVFAQRPGRIEIPKLRVAFSAAGGFGTEPEAFRFETPPLVLAVEAPPGTRDPKRLVTTPDFTLRVEVEPEPEASRVGDAFTRRIERRVEDASAIALAPLVEPEILGVARYARPPRIDERRDRGSLVVTRVDETTFVLQEPGPVRIPGFELEWWDPEAEELHTETVPAIELEVAKSPLWTTEDGASGVLEAVRRHPVRAAVAVATMIGVGLGAVWGVPRLSRSLARRRAIRREGERARFRKLMRACRANDACVAFNAWRRWLESRSRAARRGVPGPSLDDALAAEILQMQEALVRGDESWRGRGLARAAREWRRRGVDRAGKRAGPALADLNPRGTAPAGEAR